MYYFLQKDLEQLDNEINNILSQLKKLGQELGESCKQSSETWHDNFPYEEAKRQAAVLEIRLNDLLKIRRKAQVIQKPDDNSKISIGHTVKIADQNTGKEENILIGSYLTLDEKSVSYESPLGKLIIGAKCGETKTGKIGSIKKSVKIIEIL